MNYVSLVYICLPIQWPVQQLPIVNVMPNWVGIQQGQYTSWGEGASLALVGHLFSDGITIKIPYGVYVLLHWPSFPIGLVKTKSDFIVRSIETGLGRWMLVVDK